MNDKQQKDWHISDDLVKQIKIFKELAKRKQSDVRNTLTEIDAKISGKAKIIAATFRISIGSNANYYHPVYCQPSALYEHFDESKNQDSLKLTSGKAGLFLQLFRSKFIKKNSKWECEPITKYDEFGEQDKRTVKNRISKFIPARLEKKDDAFIDTLVFIKREKSKEKKTVIKQFGAIYFSGDFKKLSKKKLDEIRSLLTALSDQVSDITRQQEILFKEVRYQLFRECTQVFLDHKETAADRIGFALHGLEYFLKHYMDSRELGRESSDRNEASRKVKVLWVSTKYSRNLHARDRNPTLLYQLYPHAHQHRFPGAAFELRHPEHPALVKFCLNRYLSKKNVQIIAGDKYDELVKLDSENNWAQSILDYDKCYVLDSNQSMHEDEIAISSNDEFGTKYWKKFYLSPERSKLENSNTKGSFLCYVIEGSDADDKKNIQARSLRSPSEVSKNFPHGILAVESNAENSFPAYVIENIGELASDLGFLVRASTDPHSQIDYEDSLSETFGDDIFVTHGEYFLDVKVVKSLYFHLLRIDSDAFKESSKNGLIAKHLDPSNTSATITKKLRENSAFRYSKEKINLFQEAVFEIAPAISDAGITEIKAGSILRLRHQSFVSNFNKPSSKLMEFLNLANAHVGTDGEKQVSEFLALLKAMPSNFVWSHYLSTTSSSMAHRARLAKPVTFNRIDGGYSAEAVILANIADELSQVLKLSDKNKLETEYSNYQKYVRYRMPFCTRLSEMPIKLESSGEKYLEQILANRKIPVFGALVSDFVGDSASKDGRSTLLDSTSEYSINVDEHSREELIISHSRAITDFFTKGMKLWKKPTDDEKKSVVDYQSTGDKHSRLVSLISNFSQLPDNYLQKFSLKAGDLNKFELLIKSILNKLTNAKIANNIDLNSTIQIIHGDLNPRNLIWSTAFREFLAIDFEHTQPGLGGIDQWKLAISLLTDYISACVLNGTLQTATYDNLFAHVHELSLRGLHQVFEACELLTDFIEITNTHILAPNLSAKQNPQLWPTFNLVNKQQPLAYFMKSVLCTIYSEFRGKEKQVELSLIKSTDLFNSNSDIQHPGAYFAFIRAVSETIFSIRDLENQPRFEDLIFLGDFGANAIEKNSDRLKLAKARITEKLKLVLENMKIKLDDATSSGEFRLDAAKLREHTKILVCQYLLISIDCAILLPK